VNPTGRVLVWLVAVSTPWPARASPDESQPGITGQLNASATLLMTGGNVERLVLQSRFSSSVTWSDSVKVATENSYRLGRNRGRLVEDDLLSHNYVRGLPSRRVYPVLFGTAERNFRRSIPLRWQVGASAGWWWTRAADGWLRSSLGLAFEDTRFTVDRFNLRRFDGTPRVREIRVMARLGGLHRIAGRRLEIRHDHRVMLGTLDPGNARLHSVIGVLVPLHGGLSLRSEVDATYESLVIRDDNPFGIPTRTYDWVVSVGLDVRLPRDEPITEE